MSGKRRQTVSTAARHNGGANELVDDKEGSVLCGFLWKMENTKQSEAIKNNRRNSEQRDELVKVVKNVHVGYLHRLLHNQNLSMLVTYRKKKKHRPNAENQILLRSTYPAERPLSHNFLANRNGTKYKT
ncbi:hypothetical protein BDZ91DRAFT_709706 [Kalaharituber pfeilii]|nr:hypothetical protein BDZ91DRAFT_709706 [Kalaharituber pfeilii]